MKIFQTISYLVIVGLFPSCKSQAPNIYPYTNNASYQISDFICDRYGPYAVDDNTQSFIISYKTNNQAVFESLKAKIIGGSKFIFSTNAKSHIYDSTNQTYTATFLVPLDSILVDQGIEIHFYVKDNTNKVIQYEDYVYLKPKAKLSINSGESTSVTIKDTMFILPRNENKTNEYFGFNDTVDTFQNEDYFVLPLDGIFFGYNCYNTLFKYDNCYLTCEDAHGYFKNVKKDGIVKIPLKCVEENNKISFKYKNTMFVDEESLLMSLTALYGYKSTDLFYLPRNKASDLDEMEFKIIIEKSGLNENQITIPLTYYSIRNHFGNCDDSDYCIKGEITE